MHADERANGGDDSERDAESQPCREPRRRRTLSLGERALGAVRRERLLTLGRLALIVFALAFTVCALALRGETDTAVKLLRRLTETGLQIVALAAESRRNASRAVES